LEYFTSLNPPPDVTFTRILSGQAEDAFAKNIKQNLPMYLQDRPLQFKSCWHSWLCLFICVVFAVWFAVLSWQEHDFIWLGFGVMFVVFALLIIVEILEISEILHVDFSWCKIFNRTEFDEPLFSIRHSYAHFNKAPSVKAFTLTALYLEVTQENKTFGEVTFKVPWARVRQIKPCLYFGAPAVGLSFYQPILEVYPQAARDQIQTQLIETQIDALSDGYAQLVIVTAPFALEPKALVEHLEAYALFASEYYPGYV
jgi:hypothetical protein